MDSKNKTTETKFKNLKIEVKTLENDDERVIEGIITYKSLDLEGEVLLPNGMDYSTFLKRGTIYYNHNYDIPIGKVISLGKNNDGWNAKIQLLKRPENAKGENYDLADWVYESIKQGIIKGLSVGYQVLKNGIRKPTKKDKLDYGAEIKTVITRWKLLEISIAPMQANSESLITSVKSAIKNNKIDKKTAGKIIPELKEKEEIEINVENKKKEIVIDVPKQKTKKQKVKKLIEIELMRKNGRLYYPYS